MAEVDTSSYPKPAALPVQKSMLDQAQQYGAIEQQRISIDQAKLKQINDQFQIMNGELSTLANDPSITKEQAANRLLTITKTFNFPPQITKHMMDELNTAKDVPSFAKNALIRGMANNEKVNNLYGTPGVYSNGQQDTPINTSPLFGQRQMNAPIQRQIPPTQEVIDPATNKPTLQGPTAPVAPPGVATGPGQPVVPTPRARPQLPMAGAPMAAAPTPAPAGDTGVTTGQLPVEVVANRFPAPSGPSTGQSPLFEEGKKAYVQDYANASQKMLAVKPAIQALPLIQSEGFLSGPLTDQFTKAVATLKSTGLVNIQNENDPTAIRQEVAKKLYQYVSSSPVGQRSDAAQTLKEASSPNPNVQILPALIKLTKDAIALDRVEAAMPNAFKGQNYEQYIRHKGNFFNSVDEKAFTLDLEPEEKRTKIVDDMAAKLKSPKAADQASADKFFKSLRMAKEQGFYQ